MTGKDVFNNIEHLSLNFVILSVKKSFVATTHVLNKKNVEDVICRKFLI